MEWSVGIDFSEYEDALRVANAIADGVDGTVAVMDRAVFDAL